MMLSVRCSMRGLRRARRAKSTKGKARCQLAQVNVFQKFSSRVSRREMPTRLRMASGSFGVFPTSTLVRSPADKLWGSDSDRRRHVELRQVHEPCVSAPRPRLLQGLTTPWHELRMGDLLLFGVPSAFSQFHLGRQSASDRGYCIVTLPPCQCPGLRGLAHGFTEQDLFCFVCPALSDRYSLAPSYLRPVFSCKRSFPKGSIPGELRSLPPTPSSAGLQRQRACALDGNPL